MKSDIKWDGEKTTYTVLFAVVAIFLWRAMSLPKTAGRLPVLVSIITLILLLISLISSFFKNKPRAETNKTFNYKIFFTVLLIIGFYVGVIYLLGVLIASIISIFIMLVVLEKRSLRYVLAITICFNLGIYIVFNNLLNVPLLRGWLKLF